MAALLCPNCDHLLNASGCSACGWKPGDISTRNVMVNPLRAGANYPPDVKYDAARFSNNPQVKDLAIEDVQSRGE